MNVFDHRQAPNSVKITNTEICACRYYYPLMPHITTFKKYSYVTKADGEQFPAALVKAAKFPMSIQTNQRVLSIQFAIQIQSS